MRRQGPAGLLAPSGQFFGIPASSAVLTVNLDVYVYGDDVSFDPGFNYVQIFAQAPGQTERLLSQITGNDISPNWQIVTPPFTPTITRQVECLVPISGDHGVRLQAVTYRMPGGPGLYPLTQIDCRYYFLLDNQPVSPPPPTGGGAWYGRNFLEETHVATWVYTVP